MGSIYTYGSRFYPCADSKKQEIGPTSKSWFRGPRALYKLVSHDVNLEGNKSVFLIQAVIMSAAMLSIFKS